MKWSCAIRPEPKTRANIKTKIRTWIRTGPLDCSSVLYSGTWGPRAIPFPETADWESTLVPIGSEQPRNTLQKLIKLAAIGLAMLIGYKGVHASPRMTEQPMIRVAQIAALNAQNADSLKLT
jgi:hypothetical protein